MKLEDIINSWKQDSVVDSTELGRESLRLPELHHKYFKILSAERLALRALEQSYKEMYKVKYEYYMGFMDEDELNEHGWEPQPLKILKQDLPIYIDSDPDLSSIQQKIVIQKEKLELLDSVIKMIINRGFQIKNAIDWEKFKVGA